MMDEFTQTPRIPSPQILSNTHILLVLNKNCEIVIMDTQMVLNN